MTDAEGVRNKIKIFFRQTTKMGSHRTTIRRKKPLTHLTTTPPTLKRKDAISSLHTSLKSTSPSSSAVPLSVYQHASSKGQAVHRGGDSSKHLVQWLKSSPTHALRVLEVGCLEVDNAIAKAVEGRGGGVRRIDLKSRDPRIEEQDFMTLEVPSEVYSLSIAESMWLIGRDMI
jgi:25S rRNA (adenine(2142)-N(1))-methyltransferase, Bmt2